MASFVGREKELKKMHDLKQQKRAHIIVIKGRRRIGKSRLAEEFGRNKEFINFSGLAPTTNISAQDQRNVFSNQMVQQYKIPMRNFLDWSDALNNLSDLLTDKETVILFDEISWLGSKDPTFVSKLKAWWDLDISKRQNITLIFCGSVSTWIETNIINSTAFYGRIDLKITLEELTLPESYKLLRDIGFKGSIYEIYKILSVLGGVPWYLEQILPQYMADENIKRLCFEKDGLLVTEFDRIFYDLFHTRSQVYKEILESLNYGIKSLSEIRSDINYSESGTLSKLMNNLIISGFITSHYQWSLKSKKNSKKTLYRLSDSYIRFYFKYIEPNRNKIDQDKYQDLSINKLPGWDIMMGFQVENLLLQNRYILLDSLTINPIDIVGDNPYIQNQTTRQKGCQIDYLIQTNTNNLYVCEFKFNRRELGKEIIDEMKDKIKRFSVPRGFAVIPVLFHLGGVTERVIDSQYFYRIIDIQDFLEKNI